MMWDFGRFVLPNVELTGLRRSYGEGPVERHVMFLATAPIKPANTASFVFLLVCRLLVYYLSILACIGIRVKATVSTRQIDSKHAWLTL